MKRCIRLNPNDTVAVMLSKSKARDVYTIVDTAGKKCGQVTVNEEIPFGHKVSIKDMKAGSRAIKTNIIIGKTSRDVVAGDHIHIHNVKSIEERNIEERGCKK